MPTNKPNPTLVRIFTALTLFLLVVLVWLNLRIAGFAEAEVGQDTTYRYHFAMVVDSVDSPYWRMVYQGASEQGEEQDAYVELLDCKDTEGYRLNDCMRIAIAEQVDGIFVVPNGLQTVDAQIRRAMTASPVIPTLTVMENDSASDRVGFVGSSAYEQGRAYGQMLERLCARDEQVRTVTLLSATATGVDNGERGFTNELYASILEYLTEKELSDRFVLSVSTINHTNTFNCKRDIRILVDKEDCPDVMLCPDYRFTISGCQVIVDRNLVGKVTVIGSYISEELLNYIQKGTLYGVVAVDPYALGQACVSGLVEWQELGRTSDHTALELMLIHRGNVQHYREQYLEGQP